jgi:hypothetical protein
MGSRFEVAIALSFASVSRSAGATGRTIAIFAGEFADTRLKAATNSPHPGKARDNDWRGRLASSGRFDGADIVAAARRRSANTPLRRSGDWRFPTQPRVMPLVAGAGQTASQRLPNRDAVVRSRAKRTATAGQSPGRRGDTDQCRLFASTSLSNHLSAQ